jgi:hypothetical protein
MNKTVYWLVGFGAAGLAFYKLYWDTQKRYAQIIIKNGYYHADISNLLSFEKGYVKAWGLAAQKNMPNFIYNGVTYNTSGGLKIK